MAKKTFVPKYRHHKGSNQAFAQVNGCRFYLGVYGSENSQEAYGRFLAERATKSGPDHASTADQAKKPGTHRLVVEIIAAYWEHAQGYYQKDGKPSGWLTHIRLTLRRLRKLYGHTPAEQFGPLALKAIRAEMIGEGHSRKYINTLIAIIPRVFKWAASEELVPAEVYHSLRTIEGLRKGRTTAPDHPPVLPVEDTVVDATLSHLSPIVADMIRFQRLTGCRPGEVCILRPQDVDRSGEVWQFRPLSHKTDHMGRERIIFIGPKAQAVLRPYLLRPADSFCFSPAESEAKRKEAIRAKRKSKVQPSQRDRRKRNPKRKPAERYTKDSYQRTIRRGVEKANEERGDKPAIPFWHANQLRHSAATEIRRQHGIEAAQVLLGHAKADVTQVYAERDWSLAAKVMKKIG